MRFSFQTVCIVIGVTFVHVILIAAVSPVGGGNLAPDRARESHAAPPSEDVTVANDRTEGSSISNRGREESNARNQESVTGPLPPTAGDEPARHRLESLSNSGGAGDAPALPPRQFSPLPPS